MYDPAIARWMTVDPLAETYMPLSPFVYVANNPINAIDPNGMEIDWDVTRKEKRAIKKSLKQHKGSKTYRKMMRALRKSDNVYTIKSSGAKSDKLAAFAPNVGEKIPTYTQEEEDGSVTTHGGGSDPTNELGGTITFYSQNLNSLGGEVDTGVEEFVHAWQYDTYITSKDQAYMSNIPQLDWEFEAKTIVGTIVGESKMNNRFRRGPFDETPFSLASEIKRLNVGRQGLSGMYEGYHSIWLGGVDAFGGYNGLTSKTPGAVLKSQPSLLKSILKK
jgi:hypothetical protein